MMEIRKQTSKILNEVSELLFQLNDEQYSKPLSVLSDTSIGTHTRHIVEFYQCLLSGLSNGCVNYDKRNRNVLLETDRNFTQETIRELVNCIEIIQDDSLLLTMSYDDSVSTFNSSIFRELAYNIEHTVHHLAIIKIGVKTDFPEISLSINIGVAHSTVKFRQQQLK